MWQVSYNVRGHISLEKGRDERKDWELSYVPRQPHCSCTARLLTVPSTIFENTPRKAISLDFTPGMPFSIPRPFCPPTLSTRAVLDFRRCKTIISLNGRPTVDNDVVKTSAIFTFRI